MMRPYEWGSLTQEIGRRPTNIDGPVNGGNSSSIAARGCRWLVPITTGLKREAPGVSTGVMSTMRQGRSLEDSMMMNIDAYDNSLKRYSQKKYGVPMSVYSDKHTTDQSTAKLSIQGGLNNSVPLSEFEKGLKELGMESPPRPTLFKRKTGLNGSLDASRPVGQRDAFKKNSDDRRGQSVFRGISSALQDVFGLSYGKGQA